MKKLFDGDWQAVRNAMLAIATSGGAVCGYLAANSGDKKL